MGVGENFKEFCNNIILSDSIVSTRYKAITHRLNTVFWDTTSETSHSFYSGSYGRNTAIKNTSDMDVIFQLPYGVYEQYNNHYGNGQSALLQAVRESIKKTYSVTNISADGQIVQIPFKDGITFEVVPAFINKDDSYTYPDANNGGRWLVTDPKPEIEAIRKRNDRYNNNLIFLCRMMRAWKEKWGVPINGMLIDTLAYQFITDWQYKDKSYLYYDFLSRDFFKFMADQDKEQEYWHAPGSGRYVYGKGLFHYKATRCYNISLEAIAYQNNNQEWSEKQKWRDIYGTSYPS